MTSLLVDTHALLWWRGDYKRIGAQALEAIEDPAGPVYFSAASVWEMAIKDALGKLEMPEDLVATMEERGFLELPVLSKYALVAGALPLHHADPFDRMLVGQAQSEGLTLVTNDKRIAAYDVLTLW